MALAVRAAAAVLRSGRQDGNGSERDMLELAKEVAKSFPIRCITFVARPLCRPYRYANDLSIQMSSPLPPPFPPFPLSGFVALLVSPPNPPSNDAPIRPSPVPPPPTPALSPPPSPPLPPPASSEPSLNGRLLAASVGGGDSSCSTPASSSPESSPRLRGLYGHSQSSVLVVLSSRLSKDSEPVLTNHRLS